MPLSSQTRARGYDLDQGMGKAETVITDHETEILIAHVEVIIANGEDDKEPDKEMLLGCATAAAEAVAKYIKETSR
jgi:hypothetical protein